MTTPPSPSARARVRVREEMTQLIIDAARRQLGEVGGAALSVRAVAREIGMSSSAVFRYFPSRDALLTRLIVDSYDALGEAAEQAEARVHDGALGERWRAICHGVRDWALAHPHEYTLIFGSPIPGYAAPADTLGPAGRVPALLSGLLAPRTPGPGGTSGDGPTPPDRPGYPGDDPAAPADDALRASFAPLMTVMPPGVPPDLAMRGLMAWTYLFGAVSIELFGHRAFVVSDPATFFDHEVVLLAERLGIT